MHIIDYFIAFGNVGDRLGGEVLCVRIHVHLDVVESHLNRSHDFWDEFGLLDHLRWELELVSVQDGLVAQHFLSLLFSNYLFIRLFCVV